MSIVFALGDLQGLEGVDLQVRMENEFLHR